MLISVKATSTGRLSSNLKELLILRSIGWIIFLNGAFVVEEIVPNVAFKEHFKL